MISVVLFDLGGVVCRFNPAPRLARLAALSGLPESEVHTRIWQAGLAQAFDRGDYTSEQWFRLVSERLAVDWNFATFEDVMLSALTVDDETIALVDDLRPDLRVALLTDNPPLLRDAIPRRFPALGSRFDPMLFSYELGVLKPAPEAFTLALERLDVPAERVLFIDDTLVNVEAARTLGMNASLFTSAADLRGHFATLGLTA